MPSFPNPTRLSPQLLLAIFLLSPQTTSADTSRFDAQLSQRARYTGQQDTGQQPPDAVRRQSAASLRPISRTSRPAYHLDAGDVLATIVDGVLGDFGKAPVHMPTGRDDTLPAIGYPTPVLRDGTIVLPLIDPVSVRGLSVTSAKQAIVKAYRDQQILKHNNRVSLTLMRKRTIGVTVVHDSSSASIRRARQIRLPSDRSSVLGALVESGAFDPRAEVQIHSHRGRATPRSDDSTLQDRDIVQLHSAPNGYFYTGGRLPAGQFPLPRDRQLSTLQAIAVTGGLTRTGILRPNQITVVPHGSRAVVVNYGDLLNNATAMPIRPGDTIIAR